MRTEPVPAARIGIGLDFGTSNSTAAWFDGQVLHGVPVEDDGGTVLPTALHLDREYAALTGRAAIRQYVDENRGRRVELVPEVIGEAADGIGGSETGDDITRLVTNRRPLYGPPVDRGLPGRLFHGLKRLLGDATVDRLAVFGLQYRIVALVVPILVRLRDAIQRATGEPITRIHVGRPVNFEGRGTDANRVAMARLTEATGHPGLRDVTFYPEPVAATLSYLWSRGRGDSGRALTVDFGGGTLDLAVLAYSPAGFDVLGTDGIGLGGDRIDQLIYEHLLFPELGKGEPWSREVDGKRVETLFPFEEFEAGLLNWPITHTLNSNRLRTMVLDRIARGGPGAAKLQRLHDLITYNYSYTCFLAIRTAKAELSSRDATVIDIPELDLQVPFTRARFEEILAGPLREIDALLTRLLERTGLAPDDIDIVIRTGGSSLIVAVRGLLERRFPGKVVEHDPFNSVAAGLAIASYHGYRCD
jgi:hypothetical chaperone protein